MKSALTLGLALSLAGPLLAEDAPKEAIDKTSYAIGANIGEGIAGDLKELDIKVNPEFVARGMRDAFNGKFSLDENARREAYGAFQQEAQTKLQAKQQEAMAANQAAASTNKTASEKFLEENKKKEGIKTTASGLQYKEEKTGTGPKPGAGDRVKVHYAGRLIDGKEFDSSYKRNEPVDFGVDQVIPGWTEALQLMPAGSKWQLYIPPALAYGENGPDVIGPNQALIFDVELLEVHKDDKEDKGGEEKKDDAKQE